MRNKVEEMEAFLLTANKYNIVMLSEHWLTSHEAELCQLNQLNAASFFARGNGYGGVMNLVSPSIISKELVNITTHSVEIHCELAANYLKVYNLVIISVYRSPRGDFHTFSDILNKVLHKICFSNYNIIVCGDFNVPFDTNDQKAKAVCTIFREFGLRSFVDFPTRLNSRLDNVFSNLDVTATKVKETISDHAGVCITVPITCDLKAEKSTHITRPITTEGKITYYNLMSSIDWNFINIENNINLNQKMNCFLNILITNYKTSFPEKTVKNKTFANYEQWYTNELSEMRNTLHLINESYLQLHSDDLRSIRNQYRSEYRKAIKNAKIVANDAFIQHSEYKPQAMWKVINNKKRKNTKTEATCIDAEDFNHFFTTITDELLNNIPHQDTDPLAFMPTSTNTLPFSFQQVSCVEVRDIITGLKNKHSRDIYGIDIHTLKSIKETLIAPLTKLINLCIDESIFPDSLKVAKCIPIFKKGTKSDKNNYRPISLLPVISKIFETILNSQIYQYFEVNSLFTGAQFGFRRGKSTTEAIIEFVENALDAFEGREYVLSVFLDLSKAFDCVSHTILLRKLYFYNFLPSACRMIVSYLSDRKQVVFFESQYSSELPIEHGVPQGSILGPLLFLIFINDFPSSQIGSKVVLFADDTTLSNSSTSLEALTNWQVEAQSSAQSWYNNNKLCLNQEKTVDMLLSLRDRPVGDHVKSARFLGLHIDPFLQWHAHGDRLSGKLSSNIYLLRNLSRCVSRRVVLTAYYALCQSHLSYGLIVWGHSAIGSEMFALQRRAVRIVAGLRYRDDCRQAFIDLGILTLPCLYILNCVLWVISNLHHLPHGSDFHGHDTRSKLDIRAPQVRLKKAQNSIRYYCFKFYNVLPVGIKDLELKLLKPRLKQYLIEKAFFSVEDFISNKCTDFFL